jgi:hypothetical protein
MVRVFNLAGKLTPFALAGAYDPGKDQLQSNGNHFALSKREIFFQFLFSRGKGVWRAVFILHDSSYWRCVPIPATLQSSRQ